MSISLMNFIGGINVYVTSPSHLIICSAQSVPGLVGVVRRGSSMSSFIGAETFYITVMLLQSPRCPGWGSVVLLFPCRVPGEVVFKLWQLWSCFQVGSIVINLNNWLKNWVLDHIRSKEGLIKLRRGNNRFSTVFFEFSLSNNIYNIYVCNGDDQWCVDKWW